MFKRAFLNSVTGLGKCPFCQIKLKINEINNLCLICNTHFGDVKNNITCPNCKTVFHKDHFQEWIKIKGFCKNCKKKITFN